MRNLIPLPTRRIEAWKYSDLSQAMGPDVQIVLSADRAEPAVASALTQDGVIAALASQAGEVADLEVPADGDELCIVRPRFDNLAPRFTRIRLARGAKLTRVVIQAASHGVILDGARVSVGAGATFRQFILAEGARLARIETQVDVEGEAARVELHGVYAVGRDRHADLTSIVTHKAHGGTTEQLIKGVADEGGRGVFQGRIVVERGAQKTDARQHHRGVMLADGAEIFAKPELMIHADDVGCAHGNTIGGLDETALFYLRSRGIPEAEARALLTEAFLLEAVPAGLPAEMRAELEERIGAWLRGRG